MKAMKAMKESEVQIVNKLFQKPVGCPWTQCAMLCFRCKRERCQLPRGHRGQGPACLCVACGQWDAGEKNRTSRTPTMHENMFVSQQWIDPDRPCLADFTEEKSLEKSLGSL